MANLPDRASVAIAQHADILKVRAVELVLFKQLCLAEQELLFARSVGSAVVVCGAGGAVVVCCVGDVVVNCVRDGAFVIVSQFLGTRSR